MPFSSTHPALAKALTARGYTVFTPVQQSVLAPEARGRDLLVSAQTGSGKTVAFGMAIAPTLMGDAEMFGRAAEPLALVIAPTRELAMQVARELEWLYADTGARIATCVGGMEIRREARALQQGVHIVVGTPGRLRDHLERGNLQLGKLMAIVLDEADEMLDLGFRDELEEMLDSTPDTRRTLLFSATLPKTIQTMAKRYQKDAFRIAATAGNSPHGDIDYRAIRLAPSDLEAGVVNVLRYFESGAALVFCATREAVRRLHANLVERGFAAVALSGELSQSERTHALQALRDRRARVCVATDVAARGIDLPDLGLVIHAELPNDPEVLQHRSGRTGRAGRKGICVLLVPYPKRRRTEGLLRAANVTAIWMDPPTPEAIHAKDAERMLESIPPMPEDETEAVTALLAERSPQDIAAALLKLQRERLPAPDEISDAGPAARGAIGGQGGERAGGPGGTAPRPGFEDTIWFRINAGRNVNADPRWLLPYLCRRGHITKSEIGAIRIFDRETRFEIPRAVAGRFATSLRKTDDGDPDVRIETVPHDAGDPAQAPRRAPPGGHARRYAPRR
jgi:ATP-dependent RNA helicase DeaD